MQFTNQNSTLLEHIDTKKLTKLYKKHLNVDVSHYFKEIPQLEYREHTESGIRYFSPLIAGDESFYEELQQHDWYYQTDKSEYHFVSDFTQNKRILEIGCGEGHFYSVSNCSDYTGLEFNTKAIEKCKAKNLTVFKQSIEDFAKANNTLFDVVCSFQVLEHVNNPINFLERSTKSLKMGGVFDNFYTC